MDEILRNKEIKKALTNYYSGIDMMIQKHPTLRTFIEYLEHVDKEIGSTREGNEEGYMMSHQVPATIRIHNEDDEDTYYEISEVDIDQFLGCGCWSGITITIKETTPPWKKNK